MERYLIYSTTMTVLYINVVKLCQHSEGNNFLLRQNLGQVWYIYVKSSRGFLVRTKLIDIHDEVVARSGNTDHVPPIVVGVEIRNRVQLELTGLHDDHVRGICNNLNGRANDG